MHKLLIVEDNPVAAKTAKAILAASLNADIHVASCGEEALKLFKETPFNIVLMDIGLGVGIDGAETTKIMREFEEESGRSRCPIYALTAHVEPEEIEYQRKMGLDKTYKKPLNKEVINEILAAVPDLRNS